VISGRRLSDALGAAASYEAERGNLQPLIGRVLTARFPLTDGEREFLATLLRRHDGRRGAAHLRRIERALIRSRVKGLIAEGMKCEAAVRVVMAERKLKRSTVFEALKASRLITIGDG
jgi:hypothetical protein